MTAAALSAALSVIVGVFFGLVYDAVRFTRVFFGISVRSPFGKKGAMPWISWVFTALGDLLFFLTAAVCMCVFFFLTGDGEMRGYALVGAFLGFKLYYHTIGRLFIGSMEFIAGRIRAAFRFIWGCLRKLVGKFGCAFLKSPIVRKTVTRYNEYILRKKAAAALKKRKKRMQKGGCVKNG